MTAPPPRRDADATRQRLLRAALDLFTSVGYRATTTPMLAERAGIAEGTIYRHVRGKEQLLNEVYRGAQRWATALVRELDDRALGPAERLQRLARRFVEAAERDPAALRMLLQTREHRLLDDRSREAAREFRDLLEGIVASGKSDGVVRAGPAELWAGVWLTVVGWVGERVGAGEWTPDHPQVAMALDAAWDAIRSEPVQRA